MKMLITLEPHDIFGSNFVYLCILLLSSHWYEKGEEASSSIILAGRALLVKMLITLEPPYAFGSNFEYFFLFCLLLLFLLFFIFLSFFHSFFLFIYLEEEVLTYVYIKI